MAREKERNVKGGEGKKRKGIAEMIMEAAESAVEYITDQVIKRGNKK